MSDSKEVWEEFGTSDAYYAVATFDKFRKSNFSADAKREFFETGDEHVAEVLGVLAECFGELPATNRAVDYGCGVGRILLPLARRCQAVVGVDISSSMLAECQRNAREMGVDNVELIDVDRFLGADGDRYDLVHSYIVLQHIKPSVGKSVIRKLVERLEPGGVGMLQVTFRSNSPLLRRIRFRMYRDLPGVHTILSRLRGKTEPFMPMYEYDRGEILAILKEYGCTVAREVPTDHGFSGAMFYFRKDASRSDKVQS